LVNEISLIKQIGYRTYMKRQLLCAFLSTLAWVTLNHETTHADNAFKSVGHSCGTLRTAVTCANQMWSNTVVAPACLSVYLSGMTNLLTNRLLAVHTYIYSFWQW